MARSKPFPRQRRCGVAAVEMAVVLPLFFLIVLGIIEFGRAVMVQQILTNAAREGARRAIIPGATDTQVTELVDDYLVSTSLGAESRTVEIVDGAGNAGSLENIKSKNVVGVRVTVPYDEVAWGLTSWLGGSTMQSLVQMRRE